MRALYAVVGTLLGIILTARAAERVISDIERVNMQMISSFTLVGFYEGWQRGREQTERRLLGYLFQCQDRIRQCGK